VATALDEGTGVVSLGGGAVLSADTREALAGHRVVWLKVSVADAVRRVGMNTARPLLLGNVRGTLSALLEQRNPLYEEVATDVVDTSGRGLRAVVAAVLKAVNGV
jgi:shikimate kinase